MDDLFSQDYDLNELHLITPAGREFQMLITPRFIGHYVNNVYEEYSSSLLLKHIKPGSLFIDIGAHYGYYTLLAGTGRPDCRVMAFEPSPVNFSILEKNVRHNKLSNVELYQMAVSDRTGMAEFHITEASDNCGFSGHPVSPSIDIVQVKTVRLDDFDLKTAGDIVVKMDTEGHEYEVIRGMDGLIRHRKDIRMLAEFNPECICNAGHRPEEVLSLLDECGFDIYFILDDRRLYYRLPPGEAGNWADYMRGYEDRYLNLMCVRKDKSLNVCFFSHSSELMGAERNMTELVKELIEDHGAMVTVILPGEGPLKLKLRDTGCAVAVRGYHWWCDEGDRDLDRLVLDSYVNVVPFINSELRRISPDIVITNTLVIPWGALAAEMLGIPHIWFVQEFGQLGSNLRFYRPFSEILDIIRATSSMIFTCSRALKLELFGGADDGNILTAYPYFDVPIGIGSGGGFYRRKDALRLVISGSIAEHKGQMDAVLAVRELVEMGQNVELVIAGPAYSNYIDRIKQTVDETGTGGFIRIVGWQEDVYPLVREADVVLVCSRFEGFGRVTAEAMMMGKPVIGTRSGATVELIREGYNGLLYEPGDYKGLAGCIKFFIDHKDKIDEYGKNGCEFARRTFTRDAFGGTVYRAAYRLKDGKNPLSTPYRQFMSNLLGKALQAREEQVNELGKVLEIKENELIKLHETMKIKDGLITELNKNLQTREEYIQQIMNGLVMHSMTRFKQITDRLFPAGTNRSYIYSLILGAIRILATEGWRSLFLKSREYIRKVAKKNRILSHEIIEYREWIARNEPFDEEIVRQKNESKHFKHKYKINIIIPVWNQSLSRHQIIIDSVIQQTYSEWEIFFLIDNKDKPFINLEGYNHFSARMHIIYTDFNLSSSLLKSVQFNSGKYICMMMPDCILAPFALYEIVKYLSRHPAVEFIYCDNDTINSENGNRSNPMFKPEWSPDLLKSFNYIGVFFVVKASILMNLIMQGVGLTDKYDVYDLILRITGSCKSIGHIPLILYHQEDCKSAEPEFGKLNKEVYLKRFIFPWPFSGSKLEKALYRFSLIILNKNKPGYIIPLINSLIKGAQGDRYEVIIGDTGTTDKKVLEYYEDVKDKIKIITGLKYQFSANYNQLICKKSCGEIIGMMNNDIIVDNLRFLDYVEDIIEENKDVAGAIGMRMLYPDGRLQHGGVYFMERAGDMTGFPYHRLHGGNPDNLPSTRLQIIPAVTGAFMFFLRNCFIELSGFDDSYREEAQDIDFCLKCLRAGRRNYFINDGMIIHIENGTRPKWSENKEDRRYFMWKWRSFLEAAILGSALNDPEVDKR
jgi:FkbM family methyltransferase